MHPSPSPRPPAAASRREDLVGAWRRTLLVRPDGSRDTGTGVLWLQAASLYVDTRGFAGRLHEDGDVWTWQRVVDLHPTGDVDAGRLHRDGDLLVETGRDADYVEHWEALPGPPSPVAAALLRDDRGRPAVVVRVGARLAWADAEAVSLAPRRRGGFSVVAAEGDLSCLSLEGLPA